MAVVPGVACDRLRRSLRQLCSRFMARVGAGREDHLGEAGEATAPTRGDKQRQRGSSHNRSL